MSNPLPAYLDVKERNGTGSDPHVFGKHEGFALLTTRPEDLVPVQLPRPRSALRSDPVYTLDEKRIGSGQCTVGVGPDPYLRGGYKVS